MLSSRITLPVAALSSAIGLAYLVFKASASAEKTPTAPPKAERTAADQPSEVTPDPAPAREHARLQPVPHAPEFFRFPVGTVKGHTNESVTFMGLVIDQDDVPITDTELKQLLDQYIAIGRKRTNFEASIAQAETINPNERLLRIPPYAEVGGRIEDELYAGFSSVIGADRSAALRRVIGPALYMHNFGFGDAAQSIRLTLHDTPADIRYDVFHEVETLTVEIEINGVKRPVSVTQSGKTASGATLDDLSEYAGFAQYLPTGGTGQ